LRAHVPAAPSARSTADAMLRPGVLIRVSTELVIVGLIGIVAVEVGVMLEAMTDGVVIMANVVVMMMMVVVVVLVVDVAVLMMVGPSFGARYKKAN
jgi:hypothetical protein